MHSMGYNSLVLRWIAAKFGNVVRTVTSYKILPTGGATVTLKHDIYTTLLTLIKIFYTAEAADISIFVENAKCSSSFIVYHLIFL